MLQILVINFLIGKTSPQRTFLKELSAPMLSQNRVFELLEILTIFDKKKIVKSNEH